MSSDRRRRHRAATRGHLNDGVGRNRVRPALEGLEDRLVMSASPLPGETFLTGPRDGDALQIAQEFLADRGEAWGLGDLDLGRMVVTDRYTSSPSGTTYIYLRQSLNGLPVVDSDLNVAVDRRGRILTVGGRFSPVIGALPDQAPPAPALAADVALDRAIAALGLETTGDVVTVRADASVDQRTVLTAPGAARGEVPARLQYLAAPDGSPRLAWNFSIDVPDGSRYYDANVDASTGELLRSHDLIAHASYNVFDLPLTDPRDGARTVIVDPQLRATDASPDGWHRVGAESYTDTRGNNVFAQDDTDANDTGGTRPDGGAGLVFNSPFDDTQAPANSLNAAITQVFYVTNVYHDVLYQYGFTEAAGNFQQDNLGNGGQGGDAVQADVQDSSQTNNATFLTLPDGTPGRMQMHLVTFTTPQRDTSFDNVIIVHELTHGLTNRLTGGPANHLALQGFQSGSMGEGWSDFYGLMFTQEADDEPSEGFPIAAYAFGSAGGIRRQPYSFDESVFSLSFDDLELTLDSLGRYIPHPNGEIWAAALWDLNWLLIDRQGFDADLYEGVDLDDPEASSGNQVALQLVTEALKLQPANPTYLEARDAILEADQALFGGLYAAEIWTAFARRGMGFSASQSDDPDDFRSIREARDVPVFINVAFNTAALSRLAENVPLNNVVLGTLTDRFGLQDVEDYGVVIDWGDGSPQEAAILRPNGSGGLDVIGSHTYREGGDFELKLRADRDGSLPQTSTFDLPVESWPLFAETGAPIVSREGVRLEDFVVGSFNDFDPEVNPNFHYTATIDWGDGAQTVGRVVRRADGGFDVIGAHTYREGGRLTYRVIVSEPGGQSSTALGQANVESFPIRATGGFRYAVQEGARFSGQVARFEDDSPLAKDARTYRAQINWGDGQTSLGTVVPDGRGAFTVLGTHAFNLPADGRTELAVTVTITEGGGNTATATSAATVADAPIAAEGRRVSALEGPFSAVVARFDDFNLQGQAGEFTASISWSDGVVTDGVIEPDPDGGFRVVGSRPDLAAGALALRVTVRSRGGSTSEASSTVEVSDAPIVARGLPVAAVAGPFSGVVATFVDQNPNGEAGDFAATISWGDGTTSAGRISRRDDGTFEVRGDHPFRPGTFPIAVTVTSAGGGAPSNVTGTATIGGAPLAGGGIPVSGLELATATYIVGVVTTPDGLTTAGELSAVINWGDGTTSPGVVVPNPAGPSAGFLVQGQHRYDRSGGFPISATVTGPGGTTTTIVTPALLDVVRVPVAGGLQGSARVGGFAVPGSTVLLFAQAAGGTPTLLGEIPASDVDGGWSFALPAFGDGVYTLSAASKNRADVLNSPIVPLSGGPLVVDRSGPSVRDVFLDARSRRVLVTLADGLSGLATGSLLNPANYAVSDARGRALRVSGVELGRAGADGSQVVVVRLGGRGGLAVGGYTISINGAGITDRAGNALTESFFTPFPQFGLSPTSRFVADLGTDGTRSTPPMQVVPADQVRGAGAFRRLLSAGFRRRPAQVS